MNPDSENNQVTPNNNPPDQPQEALPPSPVPPGEAITPSESAGTAQPPSSPAASSSPANSGPTVNNQGQEIFPADPIGPVSGNIKPRFPLKKLLIVIIPIILILLIAGYVFGYYIPNKPENVYKTGLDRTGQALKMITDKATEQGTYDKYKKSELTATLDINYGGQNIKGDFTAKYDDTKLDADLTTSFPASNSQQADLGLSILSETAEGKEFPDTYLNIRGIQALGADLFLPGIGKYDGKWVSIPSDYLQSIAGKYGIESAQRKDTGGAPTFEEVSALIRDFYSTTDEYVFTSDPQKAVIVNKNYLGKEDVDGISTYHYEVGLNKDNYKKYCEAFSNVILSSQAYKKFLSKTDEEIETEKQSVGDECQKGSETIKDDDTFEMWVDSKYKLIKKFRIYDGEEKKSYMDIGQNYDDGDKVVFFINLHSDVDNSDSSTDFNSELTTDFNTGESNGKITLSSGNEVQGSMNGTITLNMKPLSGDLEITEPTDTVSIEKVLKDLGIKPEDLSSFSGGASGSAL